MRRSIVLTVPSGAKQSGNTLYEPVSIKLLVVILLTALRFGDFL